MTEQLGNIIIGFDPVITFANCGNERKNLYQLLRERKVVDFNGTTGRIGEIDVELVVESEINGLRLLFGKRVVNQSSPEPKGSMADHRISVPIEHLKKTYKETEKAFRELGITEKPGIYTFLVTNSFNFTDLFSDSAVEQLRKCVESSSERIGHGTMSMDPFAYLRSRTCRNTEPEEIGNSFEYKYIMNDMGNGQKGFKQISQTDFLIFPYMNPSMFLHAIAMASLHLFWLPALLYLASVKIVAYIDEQIIPMGQYVTLLFSFLPPIVLFSGIFLRKRSAFSNEEKHREDTMATVGELLEQLPKRFRANLDEIVDRKIEAERRCLDSAFVTYLSFFAGLFLVEGGVRILSLGGLLRYLPMIWIVFWFVMVNKWISKGLYRKWYGDNQEELVARLKGEMETTTHET